jgi:hypothetical protein
MTSGETDGTQHPRFLGMPQTELGRWSNRLAIVFLVLFPIWLLYALYLRPIARPTFFSDPIHAVIILTAAAAAIAGGLAGLVAIAMKRERSFTVMLSILLGAFVLVWTVSEIQGH